LAESGRGGPAAPITAKHRLDIPSAFPQGTAVADAGPSKIDGQRRLAMPMTKPESKSAAHSSRPLKGFAAVVTGSVAGAALPVDGGWTAH